MIGTEKAIGVIGAGTMGAGIAQIAATKGHKVVVCDSNSDNLAKLKPGLEKIFSRLIEKGRMSQEESQASLERMELAEGVAACADCGLVIEAIVENVDIKQKGFRELEEAVDASAILASNTSSLPISEIAAACDKPERVVGIHFFNPAPLLPLVEIVPGLLSSREVVESAKQTIDAWGKTTVLAKDTPGFIVNRIARPFYGEALRILEEGVAEPATIDWAMKELGGFRMGPFELMDLIGNDINNKVSETVFAAFYYDPRYRPSLYQKRLVQAGLLGRKAGRGFYDYADGAQKPEAVQDESLGRAIMFRIVSMLINEAADALFWRVASPADIELAMTKGVNYPKGLLRWGDELGPANVLKEIEDLQRRFGEDRYRPSPYLRSRAENGEPLLGAAC